MPSQPTGRLVVRPIEGRRDLHRFVRLPWLIYRGNSCWVPPLISERLRFLDPGRNPFFRHSEAQLFLAERGGETVGRIAAILNRRHLDTYGDDTGFFGFFECFEDREVAEALLGSAGGWVRRRGLHRLRGPMSFTINDECGLLLDAYDLHPVVLMPYNPPYYPAFVEGCGFEKAQDLFAFRLSAPEVVPPRLEAAEKALAKSDGIAVRCVDLRRFDEEVERIHRIHSQAWSENWGAVPLTREEVGHLARELRPIVDPDLVLLAEDRGEPIGVSVTIPDLNQALRHANGRLFPVGLFRLLWHQRRIDAARVLIMGVLEPYRNRGIDATMYARTMAAGISKGYRWGEMSWILESNRPMLRVLGRLGAELYKTYRIYDLEL